MRTGLNAAVQRFLQLGLDLVYPRGCAVCGVACDRPQRHVCWDCLRKVPLIHWPYCDRCGIAPDGAVTRAFTCGRCRTEPPGFDQARAASRFSGATRELVHQLKYQRAAWLVADLTDLLEACLLAHGTAGAFDAVTAIPLHAGRKRVRGFNQAALLARELANRQHIPFRQVLHRTRATPTQTRLSAAARRQNVRGAFAVSEPAIVVERAWLLVDDVLTTGATLSEAARILRRAGARRVMALSVARG